MIRTKDLEKLYRTEEVETAALRNVDLVIDQGEYVAVMGPSGCGKSTLLNILGLIDRPSSGKYFLLGDDVSNSSERQRSRIRKERIGFVFQSFNLIDELTVYENIELPLLYLRRPSQERRARVEEVMRQVEVTARAKHYPQQLSGGQQQRVAVARAIVAKPKLILADEPTGNLDSANGEEVLRLIEGLNRAGTTVVVVTHSLHHAQRAGRIVNLLDGRVVERMAASA
jgi:putative ABC transport system ATP-binding protein